MKVTQISVFLENRKGRLYDVCTLLGENNINIMALTIAETENFGVLRIVVNKAEDALKLLKQKGFAANQTDVIIVQVEDKPGGLARVLKVFNDNNLNIEYMHAFIKKGTEGHPYMVFRVDNPDLALSTLKKNNIAIITNID